jgi:hypothetical protein
VNKRNLIIQAAVAGLFSAVAVSAYATGTGSAIGNTAQIASQAATSVSVLGTGSIQYTQTGGIPAGSYEMYVQVNSGAHFAGAAGTSVLAAALVVTSGAGSVGTISVPAPGTISADQTFVVFPITVGAGGVTASGTTFTFKPTGVTATKGSVTNVTASPGVSLTATMSLGSSASLSTTTPQADEASASTAPIVTFVNGITTGALSSGAFTGAGTPAPYTTAVNAETATIDVVNASGLSLITNINVAAATGSELLDLGGFFFKDVNATHTTGGATAPFGPDAATSFNLLNDYAAAGATLTGTVTAPAGFFGPANQKGATVTGSVFLSTNATCAGADKIAAATVTISADGSTVTFADATIPNTGGTATIFGSGVPVAGTADAYVCVQAAVPNAVTWTPGQTFVTATLTAPAALNVAPVTIAKTALYNLPTNGGNATVRSYIPAANGSGGGVYQSFIRVINTGSVSANISAAIVSDTTGLTGVPGVIVKALPAGAAATLTSSVIETAIVAAGGTAPTKDSRPRLYVSGPTSLTVQSFFLSPNGDFNEVSSGNNGGASTDNQ